MTFRTDPFFEIATKLDALSNENAQLRRRLDLSMRKDHICPRCEHDEVVHSPTVLDSTDSLRVSMAIIKPSVWSSKTEGEFEVYVCRGCGFVEWYVKEPGKLGSHRKSEDKVSVLRADARRDGTAGDD